ncbi:MAG TPA: PBP1A family penicillin-binding protein [Longimicrobiaceae bacterium]|nr:PBP1A family penicillin-binding protein [Longimicrobiaceae bacterium]
MAFDWKERLELDKSRDLLLSLWARLKAAWRADRKLVILTSLLAVGSCGSGALAAAWNRACSGTCPTAAQVQDFSPRQASQVLDARGQLLGSFYRERRVVISIRSLPRYVPLAFVSIEDSRFFSHQGVDPVRVIGAIRDNVIGGFGSTGGSTITMQLARNLFPQQLPPGEKSVRRKLAEVKLALEMERKLSKERILELYLNHIYLGAGAYGIEAAARTYFNKPASQLSITEAATLAGLPQAPSAYNPREHPDRAQHRRDRVLDRMADNGVITREQAEHAKAEPLVLPPPKGAIRAPYFVEAVRRELEGRFGELLYTGGLKIYTGIDPVLQQTAEQALEQQLRAVEAGTYGDYRHPTYERFSRSLAPGERVATTPYLQGVVVVLDPGTGVVRAMVGGRDFSQSQFNRATQALRQPGSSFKPFVYTAALEKGRSPMYEVADEPISIPMGDGTVWSPKNYDGKYSGYIPMRTGLKFSKNMVAIRLGREAGIEAVRSVAQRTGIASRIPGYPSVYIGSAAVYPVQLISAYAAFANGGYRVPPRYVVRVEDHKGRILWEPPRYPEPALEPGIAWIMTNMLRDVVDHGTGYPARDPEVGGLSYDIPAAGKTGTTNDNTDLWFVGYTPELLAGVWIGLDHPQTVLSGATGGTIAVPVWAHVMRRFYLGRKPPPEWPRPSDVVVRRVSGGVVLSASCGYGGVEDYFAAKFAPEPSCPQRVEEPQFVDPTPELPGRPVFPGQPQAPRPEDIIGPARPPPAPPAEDRKRKP